MKHKKTYYRPKQQFMSFGPCCGHCGCLLAILAPHFHPMSSCSWWQLGVLWWWWSGLSNLEVLWVNQQGHMTTHLTGSLVPEYLWHCGNRYGVARVWQTQTHTHTCDTLSWVYLYPCHVLIICFSLMMQNVIQLWIFWGKNRMHPMESSIIWHTL